MADREIIEYFGHKPVKHSYDGGDLYFSFWYDDPVLFIATTLQGKANSPAATIIKELHSKALADHPELKRVVVFHDWSRITKIEDLSEILLIIHQYVETVKDNLKEVVIFPPANRGSVIIVATRAISRLLGQTIYFEKTRESFLDRCDDIRNSYSRRSRPGTNPVCYPEHRP